ncbi:MAG: acyl-ACP--UDP-N-acetylglucosamine O-acyltransferase [Proteobacteria bacterium]|nr:acyl-ACP--UDP-N-acetylglucosamine O-acyltransferase [Pseudomonadota bacterium]MBU1711110.1 acyl-ACP--UDP-N-acetylglucosamine O-acyltransferase [Pseudomonadota bacterium]
MSIHPTAIIDPGAELDSSVTVGPYAIIEKGVKIGAGSEVAGHAVISGSTFIGERNKIGSFSTIGVPPQDLKYNNEDTRVVIGNDNIIREYVSIHRGTPSGRSQTTIGSNNLLMAYVHIAHDCKLADYIIMANAAQLSGHVDVEDRVTFGGFVAVHQFTRIGKYAYVGGMSGITKDVPPYLLVSGTRSGMRITGINKIGLKRSGFDNETIRKMMKAYQIIFKTPGLLLKDALDQALEEIPDCEPVEYLVNFFNNSQRNVVRESSDDE